MTALALDGDGKGVGGRIALVIFQTVNTGDFAGGIVTAKDGIHPGIFQTAGIHHALCAAVALFIGLEEELYIAAQFFLVGGHQLCRTQQRGGMAVVTAGVHDAVIFRSIGQAGILFDGQSVHIGTQADGLALFAAPKHTQHAGVGDGSSFNTHGFQFPDDQRLSAVFLPAQLGMGVDITAKGDHVFRQGFCFL